MLDKSRPLEHLNPARGSIVAKIPRFTCFTGYCRVIDRFGDYFFAARRRRGRRADFAEFESRHISANSCATATNLWVGSAFVSAICELAPEHCARRYGTNRPTTTHLYGRFLNRDSCYDKGGGCGSGTGAFVRVCDGYRCRAWPGGWLDYLSSGLVIVASSLPRIVIALVALCNHSAGLRCFIERHGY